VPGKGSYVITSTCVIYRNVYNLSPSISGSLIITFKMEIKEIFCITAILLYFLQNKNCN
jgi:hypothetical protein